MNHVVPRSLCKGKSGTREGKHHQQQPCRPNRTSQQPRRKSTSRMRCSNHVARRRTTFTSERTRTRCNPQQILRTTLTSGRTRCNAGAAQKIMMQLDGGHDSCCLRRWSKAGDDLAGSTSRRRSEPERKLANANRIQISDKNDRRTQISEKNRRWISSLVVYYSTQIVREHAKCITEHAKHACSEIIDSCTSLRGTIPESVGRARGYDLRSLGLYSDL